MFQSESEILMSQLNCNQAVPMFQLESEILISQLSGSQAGGIPFSSGESQPFVLFRPSTGWMRPNHIRENNVFFSLSV